MDKCPKFEFEVPTLHGDNIPNATFTLNGETGFYNDLQENFGIEKDWVTLGRRLVRINNGCQSVYLIPAILTYTDFAPTYLGMLKRTFFNAWLRTTTSSTTTLCLATISIFTIQRT
jgi:hypothetical protein